MKLYHVSYENLGSRVTLIPRVPQNPAPGEDVKVKRVCVSPRIGDCLRLFAWADGQHKVHVYSTEVKQVPAASWMLPKKYVPDYRKWSREEVWLLSKEGYQFERVGYVRMFRVEMVIGTAFWYFKRGGSEYGDYFTDPTRIFDEGCWKQYVKNETHRHHETRQFIKECKEGKPRLAKYADDVMVVEQIKKGEKPYRIPMRSQS